MRSRRLPSISVVDLPAYRGEYAGDRVAACPGGQNWGLVDNDLSLLARVPVPERTANLNVATLPIDLTMILKRRSTGPIDLVTTSALLDLVSTEC